MTDLHARILELLRGDDATPTTIAMALGIPIGHVETFLR